MYLLKRGRTRAPNLAPIDWAGEPDFAQPGSGRTLLLDFFSFGDPAGLHALPRLRAMSEHYRAAGLSVIGVHVPAYDFERPIAAARREIWRLGIPYPVALDHGLEVFRTYALGDLPARVLVDGDGFVRGLEQGPGDLELIERAVRSLLRERPEATDLPDPLERVDRAPGIGRVRWRPTPEILFGTRSVFFGPPDARDGEEGSVREFEPPPDLRAEGMAYPRGRWWLGRERITSEEPGAGLSVVYEGATVSAVLSLPETATEPGICELALDGAPLAAENSGADVERDEEAGSARLRIDRGGLYELIFSTEFGVHHLDVRLLGGGMAVHLLHFGTIDVSDAA